MHYDSEKIEGLQILEIVVYKHEADSIKKKKDGTLSKRSVWYQVTSIRKCEFFPPQALASILSNPYKHFNTILSDAPFENWYLATVKADEYRISDISVVDVTDRKDDDTLFLH